MGFVQPCFFDRPQYFTLSSDTLLRLAFMFVLNISLKSIFQPKCHNRVLVSVGLAD